MHSVALVLVALAGFSFVLGGVLRWRRLFRPGVDTDRWLWPMWLGLGLLSGGLVCSLIDGRHRDFGYAVLGIWAAIASLFFLARYLTLPSRGLLVLPLAAMALLVVMASMASGPAPSDADRGMGGWLSGTHIVFMAAHMAAIFIAGTAAAFWLLARRQLKGGELVALKLPSLPLLEAFYERGLVVSAALLIGGLATGGAAIQQSEDFELLQGTPLLGLLSMALLIIFLGLRAVDRISKRSMAGGTLAVLAVTSCSVLILLFESHGR